MLALLNMLLSLRVIRARRGSGVPPGTGSIASLERAARVHANFAECVPFALLLMLLVELSGAATWTVHSGGAALLVGRIARVIGMSREPEDFRFRVTGIALTFTTIIALALALLLAATG